MTDKLPEPVGAVATRYQGLGKASTSPELFERFKDLPAGTRLFTEDQLLEAVRVEREACVAICEALKDRAEEEKALANFKAAEGKGVGDALARGQHWSAVSLYNAGLNNAAVAIRSRS